MSPAGALGPPQSDLSEPQSGQDGCRLAGRLRGTRTRTPLSCDVHMAGSNDNSLTFRGLGFMNIVIPVGESLTFTFPPNNNGVIQAIAWRGDGSVVSYGYGALLSL